MMRLVKADEQTLDLQGRWGILLEFEQKDDPRHGINLEIVANGAMFVRVQASLDNKRWVEISAGELVGDYESPSVDSFNVTAAMNMILVDENLLWRYYRVEGRFEPVTPQMRILAAAQGFIR